MQGSGSLSSTLGPKSLEKGRSGGIEGTNRWIYGSAPSRPKGRVARLPKCWECGDEYSASELTLCENCCEFLLCQKKEDCVMTAHLLWCKDNERTLTAPQLRRREKIRARFRPDAVSPLRMNIPVETNALRPNRKRVAAIVGKGADQPSLSRANLRMLRHIVSEYEPKTARTCHLMEKLAAMEAGMAKAAKANQIEPLKADKTSNVR